MSVPTGATLARQPRLFLYRSRTIHSVGHGVHSLASPLPYGLLSGLWMSPPLILPHPSIYDCLESEAGWSLNPSMVKIWSKCRVKDQEFILGQNNCLKLESAAARRYIKSGFANHLSQRGVASGKKASGPWVRTYGPQRTTIAPDAVIRPAAVILKVGAAKTKPY
jgi:hypothetical protein